MSVNSFRHGTSSPELIESQFPAINVRRDSKAIPSDTGIMEYSDVMAGPSGRVYNSNEVFDPEDYDSDIERWIANIDKMGVIYNWTEHEKSLYMREKLGGRAKTWVNKIKDLDLSWEFMKNKLKTAFPSKPDFASMLKEVVRREKKADETMLQYYKDKLRLCERVQITGVDAVSCVILGLPEELKASAYVYKFCSTVGFYTNYLVDFDTHPNGSLTESIMENHVSSREEGKSKCRYCGQVGHNGYQCKRARLSFDHKDKDADGSSEAEKIQKCFICSDFGHYRRHCPKRLSSMRCIKCDEIGHNASQCKGSPESEDTDDGEPRKRERDLVRSPGRHKPSKSNPKTGTDRSAAATTSAEPPKPSSRKRPEPASTSPTPGLREIHRMETDHPTNTIRRRIWLKNRKRVWVRIPEGKSSVIVQDL